MELSASELKSALYRMFTGAGFEVGAAEDLARAGALGAGLGLAVCDELVAFVDHACSDTHLADGKFCWQGQASLVTLLSAIDLLQAGCVHDVRGTTGSGGNGSPLTATCLALLLAPETSLVISANGAAFLSHNGALYCLKSDAGDAGLALQIRPASKTQLEALPPPLVPSPIQIASQLWQVIMDKAARSYVASSLASRTSGAGAGLSDND